MTYRPTQQDKKQIKIVGRTMMAMQPGAKVAVMVDRGGTNEGKADYYLQKFKEKFPAINAEYIGPMSDEVDVIRVFSPVVSQN